jgi:hypothetical protein
LADAQARCALKLHCIIINYYFVLDCKDEIRSDDWQPVWVREGRSPTFITGGGGDAANWKKNIDSIAFGISLYVAWLLQLSC